MKKKELNLNRDSTIVEYGFSLPPSGQKRLSDLLSSFLPSREHPEILVVGYGAQTIATALTINLDTLRVETLHSDSISQPDNSQVDEIESALACRDYDMLLMCFPYSSESFRPSSLNKLINWVGLIVLLEPNSRNIFSRSLALPAAKGIDRTSWRESSSGSSLEPESVFGISGLGLSPAGESSSLHYRLINLLDRFLLEDTFLENKYGTIKASLYTAKTVNDKTKCVACSSTNLKEMYFIVPYRFWKCKHCGSLFAKKVFRPSSSFCRYQREWDNRAYESYYTSLRYRQAEMIIESLRSYKNVKSILDIGCGRGFFLVKALEYGYEAEGIDISLPDEGSRLAPHKMRVITIENKVTEGRRYDCLSLLGVLEHVGECGKFIENCRRLLHIPGIIICSIPMLDGPLYVVCERLYRYSLGLIRTPWLTLLQWHSSSPHIFMPSKKGLKSLLKAYFPGIMIEKKKQPIIDRPNLYKRIELECQSRHQGKGRQVLMYFFGLAAVVLDFISDLLGLVNEALFVIEVRED